VQAALTAAPQPPKRPAATVVVASRDKPRTSKAGTTKTAVKPAATPAAPTTADMFTGGCDS
jgi:hypothetical protein